MIGTLPKLGTANLVRFVAGPDKALYRLEKDGNVSYVIISTMFIMGRSETLIFAANEHGERTGHGEELPGSFLGRGHDVALRNAGYHLESGLFRG